MKSMFFMSLLMISSVASARNLSPLEERERTQGEIAQRMIQPEVAKCFAAAQRSAIGNISITSLSLERTEDRKGEVLKAYSDTEESGFVNGRLYVEVVRTKTAEGIKTSCNYGSADLGEGDYNRDAVDPKRILQ